VKTFSENFNILGGILMAAGTWKVVRSRNPRYLLILYSLGYWIALSFLALHWSRWSLPMDIAPLFLTALGIVFLTADENFGKIGKSLGQVIIVAFILILSIETIFVGIQMTYPDTRVISLQYCELENITKENAIYEGNSPLRPLYSKTIFEEYLSDHSDKKYLILSSFMYNNFFNERDRYEEEVDLYNEIRSDNQLLAEFSATPNPNTVLSQLSNIYTFVKSRISGKDPGLRKGPTIEIYLISD
jgi:hypothetical protein